MPGRRGGTARHGADGRPGGVDLPRAGLAGWRVGPRVAQAHRVPYGNALRRGASERERLPNLPRVVCRFPAIQAGHGPRSLRVFVGRILPAMGGVAGRLRAAICAAIWSRSPPGRREVGRRGDAPYRLGFLWRPRPGPGWSSSWPGISGAVRLLPEDRPQLPEAPPRRPALKLLEEALRRDIHFIHRHANDYPQGLFQCLWNTCWWHDCEEAAAHYVEPYPHAQTQRRRRVLRSVSNPDDAPSIQPEGRGAAPPVGVLARQKAAKLSGNGVGARERPAVRSPWSGPASRLAWTRRPGQWRRVQVGTGGGSPAALRTERSQVWDAESGAELAVLCRHESGVSSVAYSPDGRRITSGSWDGAIRVWEVESGAEIAVVCGDGGVNSIAYSPDGRRIASSSVDGTVRVWDTESGAEVISSRAARNGVNSVVYSPDARWIATGSDDGVIRVWSAKSGTKWAALRWPRTGDAVTSVVYSPDGRRIASGSRDGMILLWDADSGTKLEELWGHPEAVTSVRYSPDGRRIASGSQDGTISVCDAEIGTLLATLYGHEGGVNSVAYSPDGRWIASGSDDNTVRVWNAETAAERAVPARARRLGSQCRVQPGWTAHCRRQGLGFWGARV